MPELYDDRVIQWIVHVVKDTGIYDTVIVRDLLRELGITMNFKGNTVTWDDSTIHMRSQLNTAEIQRLRHISLGIVKNSKILLPE
jgi:hypothetical protein